MYDKNSFHFKYERLIEILQAVRCDILWLYINLLNLSWIVKCLFLRNMEPLILYKIHLERNDFGLAEVVNIIGLVLISSGLKSEVILYNSFICHFFRDLGIGKVLYAVWKEVLQNVLWSPATCMYIAVIWRVSIKPSLWASFPYRLKNRHFNIQGGFNKLIYRIYTIIKCGTWQPVKFQLVSHSWTGSKMKWFLSYL